MTATIEAPPEVARALRFDAAVLARGWHTAWLATGQDDEQPVLFHTLLAEWFPNGVRLVGTDGALLFASWVPDDEAMWTGEPAPAYDEAPEHVSVLMDPHARAGGLLAYLLKLTSKKDAAPLQVMVTLGKSDELAFEGLERKTVEITAGNETVELRCFEGDFPDWRAILGRFEPATTEAIGLSPVTLGRVAKLANYHDGRLIWRFGGADRLALVEIPESLPGVVGAVAASPVGFQPPAEPVAEPLENISQAVVDLVNEGGMGEGWTAEMTPGGAVVAVDIEALQAEDDDYVDRLKHSIDKPVAKREAPPVDPEDPASE